jgi:hypothetical protein
MGGLCGGGSGGVGSANTKSNDTGGSGNSFSETVANWFTPGDNMRYEDGILVDTSKGEGKYTPLPRNEAGAFTNIPDKSGITVTNTNRDNRIFTPNQQTNLTQENSAREKLANALTLFDGASYVGGNLIDETTGQSLTGGGYATNKAGVKNYIYGVSDDFTNNAKPERGGMSQKDYTLALAKQNMLQNIPPSDPEYFGSFLPGRFIPVVGDYLGGKMLEGGINERRAMMDQHQAALNSGAKAIMSKDGNDVYLGYETDDGVVKYEENPPTDPMTDSSIGALNMGNDGNQQPTAVWPPETGMGGGTTVPISDLNQPERMTSYDPIPAGRTMYAGPMWEEFVRDVLPNMQKQMQASNIMPNMTQNQIDEAFLIWRNTQQNSVVAN